MFARPIVEERVLSSKSVTPGCPPEAATGPRAARKPSEKYHYLHGVMREKRRDQATAAAARGGQRTQLRPALLAAYSAASAAVNRSCGSSPRPRGATPMLTVALVVP